MTRARGQDGLTLLETLVMIAVTALVGAALMNVAARANASNYARASRAIDLQFLQAIDVELRRAGVAAASAVASGYTLSGDSRSASWRTIGYAPCGKGAGVTSFSIEASGGGERLVRRCGDLSSPVRRADVIARFPVGMRGDFAFSSEGTTWRAAPPSRAPRRDAGGEQGVYLRLRLQGPAGQGHVSVVRLAGAPSGMVRVDMEPFDPGESQ